MKIHLDEHEIKEAISQYISNEGIDLSNRQTEITLTAGRGSNGHYADVVIVVPNSGSPISEDDSTPFDTDPNDLEEKVSENQPALDFDD